MAQQSSTVRFLKGKQYPGTESKVLDITARGNTRVVHLKSGDMLKTTKRGLVTAFHKVLKGEQYVKAVRSVRTTPDGTVKATIGGQQKGERVEYSTKARALAALKKRYGQS